MRNNLGVLGGIAALAMAPRFARRISEAQQLDILLWRVAGLMGLGVRETLCVAQSVAQRGHQLSDVLEWMLFLTMRGISTADILQETKRRAREMDSGDVTNSQLGVHGGGVSR